MVKRAKLTLEHTEVKETDFAESIVTEQPVTSGRNGKLGKMLIMAGITIVTLIIFKQKIL